jgi:hypothetical protein
VNAATAPRVQGVMSQVLPGYPGQTPAAVAIVVDNVKSVDLIINGESTNVPIINNSIYADLTSRRATRSNWTQPTKTAAPGSTRCSTPRARHVGPSS